MAHRPAFSRPSMPVYGRVQDVIRQQTDIMKQQSNGQAIQQYPISSSSKSISLGLPAQHIKQVQSIALQQQRFKLAQPIGAVKPSSAPSSLFLLRKPEKPLNQPIIRPQVHSIVQQAINSGGSRFVSTPMLRQGVPSAATRQLVVMPHAVRQPQQPRYAIRSTAPTATPVARPAPRAPPQTNSVYNPGIVTRGLPIVSRAAVQPHAVGGVTGSKSVTIRSFSKVDKPTLPSTNPVTSVAKVPGVAPPTFPRPIRSISVKAIPSMPTMAKPTTFSKFQPSPSITSTKRLREADAIEAEMVAAEEKERADKAKRATDAMATVRVIAREKEERIHELETKTNLREIEQMELNDLKLELQQLFQRAANPSSSSSSSPSNLKLQILLLRLIPKESPVALMSNE